MAGHIRPQLARNPLVYIAIVVFESLAGDINSAVQDGARAGVWTIQAAQICTVCRRFIQLLYTSAISNAPCLKTNYTITDRRTFSFESSVCLDSCLYAAYRCPARHATCIFILSRFTLRVDNVLFRAHDTRIFHAFGSSSPIVVRQLQVQELPRRDDLTTDVNFISKVLTEMPSEASQKIGADTRWRGLSNIHGTTVLIAAVDESEPIVTKRELWSYYLYANGNNSIGPITYTLTLFQSLATAAGYDTAVGPGSSCLSDTASGQCVLPWMGGTKSIASLVLLANGISFAILTTIFTTIGSAGDYGNFGRWLLFTATLVCWAAQYACMALISPDRWKLGMVLYIIGFVSYGVTVVFFMAAFPRLARNTPHSRAIREKYEHGDVSVEDYEKEESLQKNRISIICAVNSNIGYVLAVLLNLALLLPSKTANDPKVDNYTLVLDNSYWVLLGIWWFIYQSPRPGPPLPKGESRLTIGWKQICAALKTYKHLPYTFVYLISFFLLADGFVTTGTLVSICQNDEFNFSFLQNTYLGLLQSVASIFSMLGFWFIQRHWKIGTKKMFMVTNIVSVLVPLWGMIGIWTDKLGAYSVVFGLFQAPYYAYSQTMMGELSPPGFDNMFFGLFGLANCATSMIGPYVVQAIIDKTHDTWQGFPFLFALCMTATLMIWFGVDVPKGRRDAVRWAAAQRG